MPHELTRLVTGVDGLDVVLRGGLVAGSSYIIQGPPGAGKTILSNQIAFHHASSGQHVLYVTLLAESHERLFENLSTLAFFDAGRLGNGIDYISAFTTLRDEGLTAVVKLLRREIARKKSTLLILDGLLNAREKAESNLDVKTFIAELQGHAAFAGCTVLFLTSAQVEETSPEHTMVDGVIQLKEEVVGVRSARRLQVRKSRGVKAVHGYHQFEILDRGVVIYPRLEAVLGQPSRQDCPTTTRTGSGIADLDAMIGGGLQLGSSTLVLGPSGTGKTTLGLHFLAHSTPEELGLHFGFYETPERLKLKARAIGLDLDPLLASGALEILWQPSTENLLDGLAYKLLDAVDRRGVKRLFIDGFGAFDRAAIYPLRLVEFFSALTNELRALSVTTIGTWELADLFSRQIQAPTPEVSSVIDNLIALRFVDQHAQLRRLISIMKVRDSAFDPSFREFAISDQGVTLPQSFAGSEQVLTGTARPNDKARS
ncbi:ATPase domain-containing protein [Microvirga sp. Mcv34]|uniref:ATPase domain-containing protein n=1 Tax=Microvirga sp. Mcv34 TaxID=2926016 RepID=UPI0021C5DF8E|nr:ATPase domain-containing protein [Microvirga sp. Mcv34]